MDSHENGEVPDEDVVQGSLMSSINTILTRSSLMKFEFDRHDKQFDLSLSKSQLDNKIEIYDWRHLFHEATSLNLTLLE